VNSIIFYGVGQNLDMKFVDWYNDKLIPVCLVDASIGKQHSVYSTPFGNFKVLSLIEAINTYPDYLLYITLEKTRLIEITEYLCGIGIPYARIRYCEGFHEGGSCSWLDSHSINFATTANGKTTISSCCFNNIFKAMFLATGDFSHDYSIMCNYNDNLKLMLSLGYYTNCDNCVYRNVLTKHNAPVNEKLYKRFILSSGISGLDACNFNCSYCGHTEIKHGRYKYTSETDNKYDAIELFKIIEKQFDPNDVWVVCGAAELGISEYREKILSMWDKNKWHGVLSTNASVFISSVASLLRQRLLRLVSSLDSGTAETFFNIKGVDLFDRVLNNLEKYAQSGGDVVMKYIILEGRNDSIDEIDSFFYIVNNLCKKYPNISIMLSRDFNINHLCLSQRDKELNACKYFYKKCAEYNLNFSFSEDTFLKNDIAAVLDKDVRGI